MNKKGISNAIGLIQIAREIDIDNRKIFFKFCLKKKFIKKKFEIQKKERKTISLLL